MTDVAVVGPGAIGATFAAATERAGHAVVLCGRRPGPAPVVELPDGQEHALDGLVQGDPTGAEQVPWVLLAVKTHQTAGATRWLERLCGTGTVIAVLQNGVEHEALLGDHARVDRVADFRTEAWRKLCFNATAAPMVLTGRRAEVFREPAPLALARRLAEECVAVGRAEGARVGSETVEEIVGRIAALPPDQGTSMLFDRLAGRRLEWEARNGVIARLGAHHGIPTPVSDRVTAQLVALDGEDS